MSVLEQLLLVQEHDTRIGQLEHRRVNLPEQTRLDELEATAADLATTRAGIRTRRDELGRIQSRLEDELAGFEAKRADTDARLYGGDIRAPRELQALQDELANLAERQDRHETELLEVLTSIEPVDAELAALDARRAALDIELDLARAAVVAAGAEVDAELASELDARATAAAGIPPDRLADYERRRGRRGEVVLARLAGTSCGACHLTLSAVQVDQIRKLPADEPGTCDECGRLLVH